MQRIIIATKLSILIACIFCLSDAGAIAQPNSDNPGLDVKNYHVRLEPDINNKQLEGEVEIRFSAINTSTAIFDCGNLEISNVQGESVKNFSQKGNRLIINLLEETENDHLATIFYSGIPPRGVNFLAKKNQIYTNFFTDEWMVSHNQPHDRASIKMDLIVTDTLSVIASGNFHGKKKIEGGKAIYSWEQNIQTPSYTYGFVIGSFNRVQENANGTLLNYYSDRYSHEELKTIFRYTDDMLAFFEEKSGVPYNQTSYSQILIGDHYQEMSGFAVLKDSYGDLVLEDSTETNLISHELAHQWWGNMITCKTWNHFWLNEAIATFMSAAYNEHRFGREKYMANIRSYENVYNKVRADGNDKPLVFEDWSNPTQSDRNIVYFKGAYVLHLLREEMGDEKFWNGIKIYSQQNFGKLVTTQNFHNVLESSSGMDLQVFFDQWIY